MLLKPKVGPKQKFHRLYNQAWQEVIVSSRADPSRQRNLRCSQLPFCSLDYFVGIATNHKSRYLDMRGLYYTSVGTAVHEIMQTALMRQSNLIVGNWVCKECGKTKSFTTQPECCDFPMAYEEIDFNYKGIQGHLDTLFCNEDKFNKKDIYKHTFTVTDYKTTSMANREAMANNPPQGYIEQLLAYFYLLTKQYKLKITHIMLVFIPRDNPDPKNITIWEREVTKVDLDRTESNLRKYLKAHQRVRRIKTLKGLRKLYETYGLCNNTFCSTCRSKDPWSVLENAYNVNKHKLPLNKILGIKE